MQGDSGGRELKRQVGILGGISCYGLCDSKHIKGHGVLTISIILRSAHYKWQPSIRLLTQNTLEPDKGSMNYSKNFVIGGLRSLSNFPKSLFSGVKASAKALL